MWCRLPDHPRMIAQFANLERRALPGGSERIDHPRGQHDDVSMVVAGVLVALSTELRGPEAALEFYRRMVEEPRRFRGNTDHDDVRAPGPEFGWNMTSEPLFDVYLPAPLVPGQAGVRFK